MPQSAAPHCTMQNSVPECNQTAALNSERQPNPSESRAITEQPYVTGCRHIPGRCESKNGTQKDHKLQAQPEAAPIAATPPPPPMAMLMDKLEETSTLRQWKHRHGHCIGTGQSTAAIRQHETLREKERILIANAHCIRMSRQKHNTPKNCAHKTVDRTRQL